MRGLTHSVVNAASWLTIIGGHQLATGHPAPTPLIIGTGLVVAVSRLPDVDHPGSGPGHRLDRLLPGFPTWLARTFGQRRSPFHWGGSAILAGLLCSTLSWFTVPSLWWTGAAVGGSWLLHIAEDCLTWQGAPLLAPLSFQMIRPRFGRRFECGGPFEQGFVFPIAITWCTVAGVLAAYGLLHPLAS